MQEGACVQKGVTRRRDATVETTSEDGVGGWGKTKLAAVPGAEMATAIAVSTDDNGDGSQLSLVIIAIINDDL